MAGSAPLSQGTGYGVVLGLGFLFAFGMILTTWVLKRYNNELQTSEAFNTAGRSVKSGLVASAVVSSWTWAATLLQSSSVAYEYGVSGPFWYASGATVQIILFAYLAIELKRKAPNAHTFLEAVRARYGTAVHAVYITFGLVTNILVTAMLLTGGSAVVTALTGMPTPAACFLLPIGVVLYTMFGGIKATFLTDYAHTAVIIVILFIFAFTAYATNSILGSPAAVYDALVAAADLHPVDGNAGGSYLTMASQQGGIFFVINIIGNFGTVFLDNGYWNKAIAASPVDALLATSWVVLLALESNPVFPTYPNRMDPADVSAGLVLPNAAIALLGNGGAAATLLLVFMAVTSAMSAELIAVSSIFTFDIYKTYIKPSAKGQQLIAVSHTTCVVYSLIMAAFSTGLYYAGISLGYIYLMMGVIIGGAVLPAALTMMWDRQSKVAAAASPVLALACALIAWLVTAQKQGGDLSVASTGKNYPMLAGNVVALLTPLITIPILSLVFPSGKYDWVSMKLIKRADDSDMAAAAHMDIEKIPGEIETEAELAQDEVKLARAAKIARWMVIVLTLALLVLWPMPMLGSNYIFSKPFFTGWVAFDIIWLFFSGFAVVAYPLYEGRKTMAKTFRSIYRDITGKQKPGVVHGEAVLAEPVSEEKGIDQKTIDVGPEKAMDGTSV
ncbi:hypothetical protein AMS68_003145 [Peltaster fructicola]|uniref:Urea active transporter n=1 Tax=Peltaster fructicola TaxID=286661 RepID=A0A6H0XSN7_9PEZI|nr:hypothetical protein AMS68_003145 [Peltaster fructicola]